MNKIQIEMSLNEALEYIKNELKRFGFEEVDDNIFKKRYYGLPTTRQVIDFIQKIEEELRPFKVEVLSSTIKELTIKVDDTICYDGIVIIDDDEAVILDAADQILVSVFENDILLTDTYGLSEEV